MKAELLGTGITWLSLTNLADEGSTISIMTLVLLAIALVIIVLNHSRPGDREWHPYPKHGSGQKAGKIDYIMRRRTDLGWEYREMTPDEIAELRRDLAW
ncbi:MAG TPA: hypothetical protein VFQ34_11515 [Nitrospiraceae bacterium]|nr:hypothetical protein [Nitrospiraceae bacterium]